MYTPLIRHTFLQSPKDLDNTRVKAVLGGKPTLRAVCERIRNGTIRRVIVLCGAGISVNAGIPDFRTKGTGLVKTLKTRYVPGDHFYTNQSVVHNSMTT